MEGRGHFYTSGISAPGKSPQYPLGRGLGGFRRRLVCYVYVYNQIEIP